MSFPPVPNVIAKLRQFYGRPEQLLQSHPNKVRKLEPPRADKFHAVWKRGETEELTLQWMNPILIQDLVSQLPNGRNAAVGTLQKEEGGRNLYGLHLENPSDACEANVNYEYKPAEAGTSGQSSSV